MWCINGQKSGLKNAEICKIRRAAEVPQQIRLVMQQSITRQLRFKETSF